MRRFQLQFPLRTLLTLVLAVACYFGGRVSRDEELAEARREIQSLRDAMPLGVLNVSQPMLITCEIPKGDVYDVARSRYVTSLPELPAVQIELEDLCVDWFDHCGCKH